MKKHRLCSSTDMNIPFMVHRAPTLLRFTYQDTAVLIILFLFTKYVLKSNLSPWNCIYKNQSVLTAEPIKSCNVIFVIMKIINFSELQELRIILTIYSKCSVVANSNLISRIYVRTMNASIFILQFHVFLG